jgi:hypothetical protein
MKGTPDSKMFYSVRGDVLLALIGAGGARALDEGLKEALDTATQHPIFTCYTTEDIEELGTFQGRHPEQISRFLDWLSEGNADFYEMDVKFPSCIYNLFLDFVDAEEQRRNQQVSPAPVPK